MSSTEQAPRQFRSEPVYADGSPQSLPEYVIQQLMKAMFKGELRPGERLSTMKVAVELGVSHIPVREALNTLESSGHVTRLPRRGYFVAPLSLADVEDVYYWRRMLETEANRLAVPRLTAEDIEAMRRLNLRMRAADARLDGAEFGMLNREWHFIPVRRVGSQHIERFLAQLWDSASRYQATLLQGSEFLSAVQHQHEALMESYAARDVTAVNRLLEEHRQTTLSAIRLVLTSVPPGGDS